MIKFNKYCLHISLLHKQITNYLFHIFIVGFLFFIYCNHVSFCKNFNKGFIIEKANQLYLEKGYRNVAVFDICDACQLSKTTFYYHLKSKEDTLREY
ncbi:MAG: TetR/AcrR family transcriptional regulator [Lachnotalea sp.]